MVKADDDAMPCPLLQIWVQTVFVKIVLWCAVPDASVSNGRDTTCQKCRCFLCAFSDDDGFAAVALALRPVGLIRHLELEHTAGNT